MHKRTVVLLLIAILLVGGCQHAGRNDVVVWISMDGFRGDYVDRAATPTFHRLMREGWYSRQLTPITPSITFPSHVSEATGVTVAQHGIPDNAFYDCVTRQKYNFPDDASLLQAEPIWLTAQRQGVRTLVFEWPLAQHQQGRVRADYFREKYDAEASNEKRLERIIDAWSGDQPRDGKRPLRLVMGYVTATDGAGHSFGPDSPQVTKRIEQTDEMIGRFVDQAVAVFRLHASPRDRLYVLITTDHGMSPVKTLVNYKKLLSFELPSDVQVIADGPLGMIYLDRHPELKQRVLADLRKHDDLLAAYARDELPPQWGLNHPTRVGDVVVMLKPSYCFKSAGDAPLLTAADEKHGPLGMHGFPPADCPEMRGFCVLWRYPSTPIAKDVGEVDALRLHPTVAKLLGVKPAAGAHGKPLLD